MKRILIVDDVLGWRTFHRNAILEIFDKNEEIEFLTTSSAREAYDILLQNTSAPFDYILTDMQMEEDFLPKYAGEWLIEQIKTFECYNNTKVIIISSAYNIKEIAKFYDVNCIPKPTATTCLSAYRELMLT